MGHNCEHIPIQAHHALVTTTVKKNTASLEFEDINAVTVGQNSRGRAAAITRWITVTEGMVRSSSCCCCRLVGSGVLDEVNEDRYLNGA